MKSFFCSTTKGALLLSRLSFSLLHSACICHPLALQDIHTHHMALCRAFLETYKSISAVRTLSGQRQTRMKWQYRLEDQRGGRWYRALPSSLSFLFFPSFVFFISFLNKDSYRPGDLWSSCFLSAPGTEGYRCCYPVYAVVSLEPMALFLLGRRSTLWATSQCPS